jgi:Cof subfamily protein (haloacid dehalogenase superfamily)
MRYRLLALDLDGTLMTTEKKVTDYTKKVLLRAQEAGVRIALTSGRPVPGVKPIADLLKLPQFGGYVAACNGGRIYDCTTGENLYEEFLPQNLIPKLCAFGVENNVTMVVYHEDELITQQAESRYARFDASVNHMKIRVCKELSAAIQFPIYKFLMAADPPVIEKLISKAQKEFSECSVYRSDPYYMEFMPLGGNKAKALEALLNHLGWKREKLMACGDGFNDVSMIKYAGLGVAMENAQKPVLEVADDVTLSNDEDGVAKAVEKYCFS